MPNNETNFLERAKMAWRTRAFNRGVELLVKNGAASYEGKPMRAVRTASEFPRFFARATALKWASRQNLTPARVEQVKSLHNKPSTLRWYAEQKALGMNVGNDAQHIASAHADSVDDMIAWFNGIERFDSAAAFSLLKLGFSADRPDVTDSIAKWALGGPSFWFNGNRMSGDSSDPLASLPGHESNMCLFARCMSSVALTQWLFEHQPQLKDILHTPEKWAELQKGLEHAHPDVQSNWPWMAHHVFGVNVSLLDYEECNKRVVDTMMLHTNFAHDPAAQCYLSYHMFKRHLGSRFSPQACENPDVQAFHNKVWAVSHQEDPVLLPSTPIVDNLMVGVYLDQDPREFYRHAQLVFANSQRPDEFKMQLARRPEDKCRAMQSAINYAACSAAATAPKWRLRTWPMMHGTTKKRTKTQWWDTENGYLAKDFLEEILPGSLVTFDCY